MLINRIGTFFILLGAGLIGLYILSDIAKAPSCNFIIFGAISLVIGIILWVRSPGPPPQPSGRFRLLRGSPKKQGKK